MQFTFLNRLLIATAAPRSLRQARRDRQANRAVCALFGLMILAALLAKTTVSVVTAEGDQLDAISAALPQPDPANPAYVIDASDILLIEGGAELPAEVAGEHLVGPDGTIHLGTGNLGTGNLGTRTLVHVAGLTLAEAKLAVAGQLKTDLAALQLSITVHAFNSNVYYVIVKRGSSCDALVRLPVTGNETVLDVLAPVNNVCQLSDKNIWISRPAPGGVNCDQILPVNWSEIAAGATSPGNHLLLPGDWLYIATDEMVTLDNWVDRISSPIERVFGFSLLTSSHGQPPQLVTRRVLTFPGL